MKNKYFYTFLKDTNLQQRAMFIVLIGILALGLWQVSKAQEKELATLLVKKQVVAEIPKLHKQLARLQATGGLLLNGIIFNKERPLAVINDKVMAEGDVIGTKKLRAIWVDSVTMCENVLNGKCVDLALEK